MSEHTEQFRSAMTVAGAEAPDADALAKQIALMVAKIIELETRLEALEGEGGRNPVPDEKIY